MRRKVRHSIGWAWALLLLAGCSATKSLPPGEHLYMGGRVDLREADVSARQRKTLRSDLQGLTRPRPNTRLLGVPIKLYLYNSFHKAKPNSFFGRLRDKNGEPPVLVSSVDVANNIKLLQNHLENKGFFKAKVTGDTSVRGKRGRANYIATAGSQYKINSIRYDTDSSELTKAIKGIADRSLLKVGEAYDLDVIKGERNRIDAALKENGYFYFSADHLIIRIDSTRGNNTVDMMVSVKSDAPLDARQAFRINDVIIYANYRLNAPRMDTSLTNAVRYEGLTIIDRRKQFKPKFWPRILTFKPGDLYNRTDHNITLSRLINLNEFRYVKNRFEPVGDSAKLDAFYYLTPHAKKSLRGEINLTTKSNNLNGTVISAVWRHRNFFNQGEQLSVSAYLGSEIQAGGAFQGYNTYRTGAEMNFAIPRFVVPFFNIETTSAFVPRSNIQLGYDILNRRKLYTLNSMRATLGYQWKPNAREQHEFNPVSITYVQPLNVTSEYRDSVFKYPYLERIIDSQFIIGSTYQYNYNQLTTGIQKVNSFYFNGLADFSGNIAGLVTGANQAEGKQKRIFNAAFDQYMKFELDGRYYRRFGLKSTLANRLIIGYGRPYGNSNELPYIKQFFVGGNNSLRAFRSRSLGPGTYRPQATTFIGDQTGDIKLEANTEFRPHISGPLYGAIFLDAGNVWLANEDPTRPGSGFSKDFMKQLAIGTGVGVRLDIVLFVIRFDLGIPLRKPWEQNPWVMNNLRLNKPEGRRENMLFNLAIGYPF